MKPYERFAWSMFTLSGIFFLILGVRDSEWLTIAGAIVWMVGCAAFLYGGSR